MNGQSKVAELISAVGSAGFFKRIFSWKSITEIAVLARMEAENAESMHAAEIREITFRLSEAEKRARDAEEEYDSMSLAFVEMRETRAVEAEQCRTALENAEELTLKYEKAADELRSVRDMLTAESEGRRIETLKYAELKAEFDEKLVELSSVKELLAAEESVKEERAAEYERRVEKLNTLVEQMESDHAKAEERILSEVAEREERLSTAWQRHEKDVSESMKSIAKKHDFIRCDKDEYPNPGTPDNVFLIGGMYTVFDAKSPKNPEELSNFPQYLKAQAEGMKKYCKHENVRKDAFLVVPASTLEVLTTFMYDLAEYTVYVITPESMLPILQMLRTIENYDFAEQLSPEDRDKLCRFIGRLSHTTKRKVQIDTYFSRELVSVLREIDTLPDEFANDIAVYEQKAKLNPPMEKRAKMISVADVSADVSRIENEILGWSVVEE